jgi:hypothetical protein
MSLWSQLQRWFRRTPNNLAERNTPSGIRRSEGAVFSVGGKDWQTNADRLGYDLCDLLRRKVPILSNGIQAWVDLSCNCPTQTLSDGSNRAKRRAQDEIDALNTRVYEYDFGEDNGLRQLMEIFYMSRYTFGQFAAEIVPFPDMSGIDYVGLIDPSTLKLKRRSDGRVGIFQKQKQTSAYGAETWIELPADRIFYSAYKPSLKNPQGESLLESIPWVIEIRDKLLDDMAHASHNIGYPRYHFKITPQEMVPGETLSGYTARINKDFDDTQAGLRDVAPEENWITWDNVNIEVKSASGDFQWSAHWERVEAEAVTGLHLFPWILGLSHGTTKNWVGVQFDLLMNRIAPHINAGNGFGDWIVNNNLALVGSPIRVEHQTESLMNPNRLQAVKADETEFKTLDGKVLRGYISKDDAAEAMGLPGAFRQDDDDDDNDDNRPAEKEIPSWQT